MSTRSPFPPVVSTTERQRIFGKFEYQARSDGSIKILGDWAAKNIIKVDIPQLVGIEGAPASGVIYFHRLCAAQLQALFEEWDAEGLMGKVLTWGGAFVPRMIRGSKTTLSNHAFGTAFDINAAWNGLGRTPAAASQEGSVLELVEIAHKHGFYWGGNFSRKDGMHFEVAVLQTEPVEDEPILNGEAPEPALEAPPSETTSEKVITTTTTETPTATVEKKSIVEKAAGNATVKQIAEAGVSKLGNRVATGLATGSATSVISGFFERNMGLIIFGCVLIFLSAAIVGVVLWHRSTQQKKVIEVNSDRSRDDVKVK